MARRVDEWEILVLTRGLNDGALIRCPSCDAEIEFSTTHEVLKWDCPQCQEDWYYYPPRRREAIMATKAKRKKVKR